MLYLRRRSLPTAYNILLLFLNEQLCVDASFHRRRSLKLAPWFCPDRRRRLRPQGLRGGAGGVGSGPRKGFCFWASVRGCLGRPSVVFTTTTLQNHGQKVIVRVRERAVVPLPWGETRGWFHRLCLCAEHQLWPPDVAGPGHSSGTVPGRGVGRRRATQQIRQRGGVLGGKTRTGPGVLEKGCSGEPARFRGKVSAWG